VLQSMYSIYTENLVYSTKPKLAKCRACPNSSYRTEDVFQVFTKLSIEYKRKSGRQSAWSVFLGRVARLRECAGSTSLMAGFDIVNAGQAGATLVGC
jgi:hypothetical protein